jgi:hypothetical protein
MVVVASNNAAAATTKSTQQQRRRCRPRALMLLPAAAAAHAPALQQCPRRRHTCVAVRAGSSSSSSGSSSGGDGGDDDGGAASSGGGGGIDELAAMLSRRAAEMRLSLDSQDDNAGAGVAEPPAAQEPPQQQQPQQPKQQQQRAFAPPPAVMPPHDDGFHVNELAVFKTLGELGVAAADGTEGLPGGAPAVQPVFVYAARYQSGLPFEGPATVLLKEYQAPSVALAANEVRALNRLLGPPPARKWQAAVADATPLPPVVRLLGWLEAPPSDAAYELTGDNTDGAPVQPGGGRGRFFWRLLSLALELHPSWF